MVDDPDPSELPVRSGDPMAIQSRQLLMVAHEEGLLIFRRPVNMREQTQIDQLKEDLGIRHPELPDDDGMYYLVIIEARDGQQPVLIREGEVRGFVAALAIKAGREFAERVRWYRGMLPVVGAHHPLEDLRG